MRAPPDCSRVTVPSLRIPAVAVSGAGAVQNVIAAARSVTLRVHARRHPEVAQETIVVGEEEGEEEEVTAAALVVVAIKRRGAHTVCLIASLERP
jgi:hypothetical protein